MMSNGDFDLEIFLKNLPHKPGIYQMFDKEGVIIYVGKARNLFKRVKSYFQKNQAPKTQHLVANLHHIEITVTHSENEAYILESTLIKKHKPRYNVLMRDDKSYPYIYVSIEHDYPRVDIYRGPKNKKGLYFGPYPSAYSVRETLHLLQKLFKIRQCQDTFFANRTRPCLQYQIQRCTAPCVQFINKDDYRKRVNHAILFLKGKNQTIIDELIAQMQEASRAKRYEDAVYFRDMIAHLRKVQEQQYIARDAGDIDVIGLAYESGLACIHVIFIRAGRVIGNKNYYPKVPELSESEEIITSFITQFYLSELHHADIPKRIIVSSILAEKVALQTFLSEQAEKNILLQDRVRGQSAKWVEMALNNAFNAIKTQLVQKNALSARFLDAQKLLKLERIPNRIECFDVSHSHGEETMASCVVFNAQGPNKQNYRRFIIKNVTPGDDYGAIASAVLRRYKKLKMEEQDLPDVVIIDGGKGQLHAAMKSLEELQINGIKVVSITKGEGRKPIYDKLTTMDVDDVMPIHSHMEGMHLIQQIRDEAHRFAIEGHRKRRDFKRKSSILETIEGIGEKKRIELLKQFGGLQELKSASIEEIEKVPGISHALATRIFETLHKY